MGSRLQLIYAATVVMVVGEAVNLCVAVSSGSSIALEVTSWRNSTGHRNIKTEVIVPSLLSNNVRLIVTQYETVKTGISETHFSSMLVVPEIHQPSTNYDLMTAGYEFAPGLGWYKLYLDPLPWLEAKAACEKEGAHLAVVNSQKEADVIKSLFSRAPDSIPNATFNTVAYIGFSDLVEGQYVTIFGEPLKEAGYAVWSTNQPNNVGGPNDVDSDCGGIERNGKLNDLQCKSRYVYFCEIPF